MLVALINENTVCEVRAIDEADYPDYTKKYQIVVDITSANPQPQVGWTFDGSKLIGVPVSTKITRLAMQNRISDAENLAILAYMDDASKPYRYYVRMLMNKLNISTYIDLQRQDTIQGIMLLVLAGILTAPRANEILTTPPTEIELYRG